MQVKFTFMGQDIVKRSTDSIINRFFFFETKLREDLDRRLQEKSFFYIVSEKHV